MLDQLVGIPFPFTLTNGKLDTIKGTTVIQQSIINILDWPYASMYFNLAFGSRLEELLEEPNDTIVMGILKTFIIFGMTAWEPRVEFKSCEIQRNMTGINARVTYLIKGTNILDNVSLNYLNS